MNSSIINKTKFLLICLVFLFLTTDSWASTINVDGVTCNLHDAITAANTNQAVGGCSSGQAGEDYLILPVNGNILLSTVLPLIEDILVIEGNGTTIARDPQASNFEIFYLNFASVTINDAIITGGYPRAPEFIDGGGIYALGSTLYLNRTQLIGNFGTGLVIYGSSLVMVDSVIADNVGIKEQPSYSAGLSIVNIDNTGAGGYYRIVRSTIANNINSNRGAVYCYHCNNVRIISSTISGNVNVSGSGGAVEVIGRTHATINEVSSVVGLYNSTIINNSTTAAQAVGGAFYSLRGAVSAFGSIVSNNQSMTDIEAFHDPDTQIDFPGSIIKYSLLGLNGNFNSTGYIPNMTDMILTDSDLSNVLNPELTNNGGYTPTYKLTPTSPAIDFDGDENCWINFYPLGEFSQNGLLRNIDGNGDGTAECDAGAYEYQDIIFADGFEL